jgi:hypothetical protein
MARKRSTQTVRSRRVKSIAPQTIVVERQKNRRERIIGTFQGPSQRVDAAIAIDAYELIRLCNEVLKPLHDALVFYEDVEDHESAHNVWSLANSIREVLQRIRAPRTHSSVARRKCIGPAESTRPRLKRNSDGSLGP